MGQAAIAGDVDEDRLGQKFTAHWVVEPGLEVNRTDVGTQFGWLLDALGQARANNEKVLLLRHCPISDFDFGFDLNGPNGTAGDADDCTIEHSTVFRIETNNATAQPDITANSVAGLDGDDVENTPVTNGNVMITINGGNPNPGDTLT